MSAQEAVSVVSKKGNSIKVVLFMYKSFSLLRLLL